MEAFTVCERAPESDGIGPGFESSIPAGEEKSWEPAAKTTTIYNIKCFIIMSIFHCFNVFSFIFSLKVMHLKMPFEK